MAGKLGHQIFEGVGERMASLQNKILIVDDEERIRHILRIYLEKEGFSIEEAGEGFIALQKAEQSSYDLIILDLMLPGLDGIELCLRLREMGTTPIIIVSARGEQTERLRGFEAGAPPIPFRFPA